MREIILDTNLFIRLLIKDVKLQFEKAHLLFEDIEKGKHKGLVSILVINEIIWILENFYELDRKIYFPQLIQLFALKHIKVIEVNKDIIINIFEEMKKSKIDFTDIYLLKIKHNRKIVSFDKDLNSSSTS